MPEERLLVRKEFIQAAVERVFLNANAEIDRAGAENILATVAPANASRNLDDYIDASLSEQLRAEGFIAGMERKYGKAR